MSKANRYETGFKTDARNAGFIVRPAKLIECKEPVEDRYGELNKTATTPDCILIDPQTGRQMHVEITSGSGESPHKEAQKRVIEAAGVHNYCVVKGDHVKELHEKPDKATKRAFLLALFGWLLMI